MTANSPLSHRFGAWLPTSRVQGRSFPSAYRKQAAQAGQPNNSMEPTRPARRLVSARYGPWSARAAQLDAVRAAASLVPFSRYLRLQVASSHDANRLRWFQFQGVSMDGGRTCPHRSALNRRRSGLLILCSTILYYI